MALPSEGIVDTSREGGLLAWQWSRYPSTHRDRANLLIHALTAPLFLAGCCALIVALFRGSGWLAAAGVAALVLPVALQGRGHRREATAPVPFRGWRDLVARLFVEQWVTFPRYVLTGGFARAWRSSGPAR